MSAFEELAESDQEKETSKSGGNKTLMDLLVVRQGVE